MALKAPAAPLIVTATQGGADAFVQASFATGITGRQAYNLKQLYWNLTTARSGANGARYQFAITRRSKAAFPNIADVDVIWMYDSLCRLTTSGSVLLPQSELVVFNLELPIVEDTLYFQVDTDSTTVANTAICRLDVELDTISDLDRLNLITRSLS